MAWMSFTQAMMKGYAFSNTPAWNPSSATSKALSHLETAGQLLHSVDHDVTFQDALI